MKVIEKRLLRVEKMLTPPRELFAVWLKPSPKPANWEDVQFRVQIELAEEITDQETADQQSQPNQ